MRARPPGVTCSPLPPPTLPPCTQHEGAAAGWAGLWGWTHVQRAELAQEEAEGGGAKPHKLLGPRQHDEVQQCLLLAVQGCRQPSAGAGAGRWVWGACGGRCAAEGWQRRGRGWRRARGAAAAGGLRFWKWWAAAVPLAAQPERRLAGCRRSPVPPCCTSPSAAPPYRPFPQAHGGEPTLSSLPCPLHPPSSSSCGMYRSLWCTSLQTPMCFR